ncbi:tRNA-intron lyase [Candidatus Woesearchaeota archaeon CG10_big_fil_rev_8_21_14_0_10_37_12]|nr:MAG: tRNA-intron lyase [Candidatus Woesearchaeota archaeon CG10_big_fil_rev_8_21_14_0_10_37_12]
MKHIVATYNKYAILTENSQQAKELNTKQSYGTILKNGCVQLSTLEATYLAEAEKIIILDGKNKTIPTEILFKKAAKEKNFWIRYPVYKDFRDRGYVIKTALKFGAEFRVYGRGIKPGQKHAKWIVYPVKETDNHTWHDFAAKNRVAHSTKKKLLIGVVDEEQDVTYWEVSWIKP